MATSSGRAGSRRAAGIEDIAEQLGLRTSELLPAGRGTLRIPVAEVRARVRQGSRGKLVLVTAMTPTEHGEGKTVVAIGLAMGLARIGARSVVCLRQPSLGPVFGAKGGASGGGNSYVEPRPELDLGFTGDLDAITNAQNLLGTLVDNHLNFGNAAGIDPSTPPIPRASPLEDRYLRHVLVGALERRPGFPRSAEFVITPACEMAAIHGLAADFADLRARIGRMIVGRRTDGGAVRAKEIDGTESVAPLLRTALAPNLVATAEGTPALVHGVPYANVAHGTCSRLAQEAGLFTAEYCVVEAGFSSELGAEKFVDLVAPQTGLDADAAVVVVTARALRWHSASGAAGNPSDGPFAGGLGNLAQHVANVRRFGLEPVLALNRMPGDRPEELEAIRGFAAREHLSLADVRTFADGGAGAEELARAVQEAAARGARSHRLYADGTPAPAILDRVAREVYGAGSTALEPAALADLDQVRRDGEPEGPLCLAKTPLSLSTDAKLRGRPSGFPVSVRRIVRWPGAGFTVAYAGSILAMPGLPERPAALGIRLADDGSVDGLG